MFISNRSAWALRLQSIAALIALSGSLQAQSPPQQQLASQNQSQSNGTRVHAGKMFPLTRGGKHSSSSITISAEPSSGSGGQAFSLHLPADADLKSLTAILNGHDVSDRFRGSSAYLSAQDGLSPVKNVLSVSVKTSSGGVASGRWRSMSAPVTKRNTGASVARSLASAKSARLANPLAVPAVAVDPVCDPVAMCPAWLPPSVRFDTLQKGGWTTGANPWIQVNGTPHGYTSDNATGAQYVVVALDRQTLQLTDWSWFADSSSFSTYITKYTSNDLVIAGTTASANAVNASVDTSSIGGTNFGTCNCGLPQSYMVIGSGGQTPGTAYESKSSGNAFATGSLLEDASGNYNFQSSDIVEYAIEPQDPGYYNNPTIEMNVPANLSVNGESRIMFQAPAPAGSNGLWLLVLDRTTLMPPYNPVYVNSTVPCGDLDAGGSTRVVINCGTFFEVGWMNGSNITQDAIDANWTALAAALSAVTSDQIVFLQSIGSAGNNNMGITFENSGALNTNYYGFQKFYAAFSALGGTPKAIAGPNFTNQDNYGFVGYQGAKSALNGGGAELSTAFPGQMGVLHGTLQRDSNGLYRPAQSSPEQQGLFNDKGGLDDSDFLLSVASYQQPVDWPSNSATILLPGASSLAGQQAAYRFLSHWLLAGYYMKSIQGPHQDDLHFFFTGSTNTSINYQTLDPANLQFPIQGTWQTFGCSTSNGAVCAFQAPGDTAVSTFTTGDFNAVKAQLSLEVIYLTNTLQYLVTGSTNLKDIVASGTANVGLALSAAANTIEGSAMANLNAQQIANKQVTFSWQSLLGFLGGVAQTAADIEGFGELTPLWTSLTEASKTQIKLVASGANAVGAMVSTIGSGGGIRTSNTTLSSSPQPFAQLTTTVGALATQDLQSPLVLGFDTTADNITSDWGRLSAIGPRTTNTSDTTFFAPNQVQQYTAINALTTSAARTFYFSLLPTVYNLHYWTAVGHQGTSTSFQPSMGSFQSHTEDDTCSAFYLTPSNNPILGVLSSYQGMQFPSVGGTAQPFSSKDQGQIDYWIIDGVVSKAGTQNVNIATIEAGLAENLFSPTELNIPMLQMFSVNGPMASVVFDASVDKVSGWSNDDVCDASNTSYNDATNVVVGSSAGGSATDRDGKIITATTLINPTSGVLGQDAVLTAKVMAGSQAVTSGSVYISIDGTVAGSPSVANDGTASWTVPGGLSLGKHKIEADFAPATGFAVSSAQPSTFTVYSESADISMSMANSSINVSYSAASTPIALQIGSIAGLSGNVLLSCSGLPAGLACSFSPQSVTLAAGGSVSTAVQIVPSPTSSSAILFLTLPLVGLGCLRGRRSSMVRMLLFIAATAVGAMAITGCGGASVTTNPSSTRETGPKTITVIARVGSVSRSVGLNLNIQ